MIYGKLMAANLLGEKMTMKKLLGLLLATLILTSCAAPTDMPVLPTPTPDITQYINISFELGDLPDNLKAKIARLPDEESSGRSLVYNNVVYSGVLCDHMSVYIENDYIDAVYLSVELGADDPLAVYAQTVEAIAANFVSAAIEDNQNPRGYWSTNNDYRLTRWEEPFGDIALEYRPPLSQQNPKITIEFSPYRYTVVGRNEYDAAQLSKESKLYIAQVTHLLNSIEIRKKMLEEALNEFQKTSTDTNGTIRNAYNSIKDAAKAMEQITAPEQFASAHLFLLAVAEAYHDMGTQGSFGIQNFDANAIQRSDDSRKTANLALAEFVRNLSDDLL